MARLAPSASVEKSSSAHISYTFLTRDTVVATGCLSRDRSDRYRASTKEITMSAGQFMLALDTVVSAARDLDTQESMDLATAVVTVGLAFAHGNEDLLISMLGACADGYLRYEGPVPEADARDIGIANAMLIVREFGRLESEEGSLIGLACIAVCAVAIEYFHRNYDRLRLLTARMEICALPLIVATAARFDAARAN